MTILNWLESLEPSTQVDAAIECVEANAEEKLLEEPFARPAINVSIASIIGLAFLCFVVSTVAVILVSL